MILNKDFPRNSFIHMDLQAFPFLPSIAVIGEKHTEKSVIFLKNYPLLPIMKITSSGNPRTPL